MKLSPLQLLDYFLADFHFTLNTKFDVTKSLDKKIEDIEATPRCERHPQNPRQWTVMLELKYQPASETNTPYIFSLKLVGSFDVSETFPEPAVERLVHTNGPSVLYSIARELVREQTARGPDGPFILPTASFVTDAPVAVPAPAAAAPSATAPESIAPVEAVAAPTEKPAAPAAEPKRTRAKKTSTPTA